MMKQYNSKDIYDIFSAGFQPGYYKRVGDPKGLDTYVGKDEKGRFAFKLRGRYLPVRIFGSEVISVEQYKDVETYTLLFLLEKEDLLERFCTFCQDLLESILGITDDTEGYNAICNRYASWKRLFKPHHGTLTEPEIMGLIGELLFLKNEMIPQYGEAKALESWMGPEKTNKDFSIDSVWYEVKAVTAGKESVHISSIEQLDSDVTGYLAVYKLEKMGPTYDGIKLNQLANKIMTLIRNDFYKDLFASKLLSYGFDWSSDYDNFVYSQSSYSKYIVEEGFPRISRDKIALPIIKVQYEIVLSNIEEYKQN